MYKYLRLLKVNNYIKNILVFIPLFLSGEISDWEKLLNTIIGFISFSMMASAVYIINDSYDRQEDRQHPLKKNRPIASGSISITQAILIASILIIFSLFLIATISMNALYIMFLYVFMNFCYSAYLKKFPIIDLIIVSLGFVLRLIIGSLSSNEELSIWIVIMVFLSALFVILAKRRGELIIYSESNKVIRRGIEKYNLNNINRAILILGFSIVILYVDYITSSNFFSAEPNKQLTYWTLINVVLIFTRYFELTFFQNKSGSPISIIMNDRLIQINIVIFISIFYFFIYI